MRRKNNIGFLHTDLMKFFSAILASWLFVSTTLVAHESAPQAFVLNVSANDATPLKNALDSIVRSLPRDGKIDGPIKSTTWFWGDIFMRSIRYSFGSSVSRMSFTDEGLSIGVKLDGFSGVIDRIDFNEAGTSYCLNIQVNSGNHDVDVHATIAAKLNDEGAVELSAKRASVALNSDNFQVQSVGTCNVLWGFNWLVQSILPSLLQSYRDAIAKQSGNALADGLKKIGFTYSPYLSMNITLPIGDQTSRPFYARLGIAPQGIVLDSERLTSWLAADVDFDPDFEQKNSFTDPAPWPFEESFAGISWSVMNGMLREANIKGLIAGELSVDQQRLQWNRPEFWNRVWPNFSDRPDMASKVRIVLDGCNSLSWIPLTGNRNRAEIRVQGLHFRIMTDDKLAAVVDTDVNITMLLSFNRDDANGFETGVESIAFVNPVINPSQGYMAGQPWQQLGLTQLFEQIGDETSGLPWTSRRLLALRIPHLSLGNHDLRLQTVSFHDQGIVFPVKISPPATKP